MLRMQRERNTWLCQNIVWAAYSLEISSDENTCPRGGRSYFFRLRSTSKIFESWSTGHGPETFRTWESESCSDSTRDEWAVYFVIQNQTWFLKAQSKFNNSQKYFSNAKSKSKWSPKYLKNAVFSQQKCPISFPLTQSNSGPGPKFCSNLQSGPIQVQQNLLLSGPSPIQVQCLSLDSTKRSNRNSSMFLFKKWPHWPLLLPKLNSDGGSVFSQNFDSGIGAGFERKKQNPVEVDSGTPDPWPSLICAQAVCKEYCKDFPVALNVRQDNYGVLRPVAVSIWTNTFGLEPVLCNRLLIEPSGWAQTVHMFTQRFTYHVTQYSRRSLNAFFFSPFCACIYDLAEPYLCSFRE